MLRSSILGFSFLLLLLATQCDQKEYAHSNTSKEQAKKPVKKAKKHLEAYSTAYFAAGCFWCVEAIFESVEGVEEAVSGYSGGEKKNPTYQEVGGGYTKHAEAVAVFYDPGKVSYETLVQVFFGSHDPTTLNRQGPDRGPQYRSVAFYETEEEKAVIEKVIQALEEEKAFDAPIITQVVPFEVFWDAEDYHQDFERLNPTNSYVRAVSIPRLKRFQAKFPHLLKK